METRAQQDARHRHVVAGYYETGNEQPLNGLLTELRPLLTTYVRYKLKVSDPNQADDVVQDALLAVLLRLRQRGWDALAPNSTLVGYAYGACTFCLSDQQKRYSARTTRPGWRDDPYLLLGPEVASPAEELLLNTEQAAEAATAVAAATTAVLGLPPKARAYVVLRYYQGLSSEEAAQRLGITADSYYVLLGRAMKLLRSRVDSAAAPSAQAYARLPHVHTGDLFTEPLRLAS